MGRSPSPLPVAVPKEAPHEYRPRSPGNILDWNYVVAALAIGHTLEQIQAALPHNPDFIDYLQNTVEAFK